MFARQVYTSTQCRELLLQARYTNPRTRIVRQSLDSLVAVEVTAGDSPEACLEAAVAAAAAASTRAMVVPQGAGQAARFTSPMWVTLVLAKVK